MISVIEIYNAVRDLANKDQKGFVTPRVFNAFASVAQMSVYNSLFAALAPAHTTALLSLSTPHLNFLLIDPSINSSFLSSSSEPFLYRYIYPKKIK